MMLSKGVYAYTILLDPGHGGSDQGASNEIALKKGKYKVIYEKDLALQLTKKIYSQLKKKGYNVFLTRSVDRTVHLEERAAMAEKLKADLFISVHFNSSLNRHSNGFETYYLDNHSNVAVKKVEDAENKNLKGDELVIRQILIDLVIQRTTSTSKKLATYINKRINQRIARRYKVVNRGVKAGLFYVLALSKRPGVLLEVGFVSNKKELTKMINPYFQNKYAGGVVEGIEKYIAETGKKALF